jgi:hypothetical protein
MTRFTSNNPGVHKICKICNQDRNVSAKTQYANDNYTCDRCTSKLTRNVKSTQQPASKLSTQKNCLSSL